jgi:hypothetical protein
MTASESKYFALVRCFLPRIHCFDIEFKIFWEIMINLRELSLKNPTLVYRYLDCQIIEGELKIRFIFHTIVANDKD